MNEQSNESATDMPHIRQYEQAVLTVDLPEKDLKSGDVGTIVDVHEDGAGYTLEFFTLSGETLTVATVKAEAVRPVNSGDRIHVRT